MPIRAYLKRKLQHIAKVYKLFVLLICYILFSNFMFYNNGLPLKRIGIFPIVKYKIDSNFSIGNYNFNELSKIAIDAGNSWFLHTDSKFNFSYNGTIENKEPVYPNQMNCSDETKSFLQSTNDTIFSVNTVDPDCTGLACSFIWSCGNEIQRADIQVNQNIPTEYGMNLEDIQKIITHEFGHTAGLNHCLIGDSEEKCKLKENINVPTTNPKINSSMYKFSMFGNRIQQKDDADGMKYLYGEYKNYFPKIGDFVLSSFEIEAVSIIENQDKKHSALLPTDEQIKQSFIETLTYIPVEPDEIDKEINAWSKGESYNRNKLTVEEGVARELSEMSSYFTTIESHIPNLTDKEIDTLRINSTIAVNSFYRLTDILSNEHTQILYYLQQTLEGHHRIRRKAIDEKNSRNP